MKSITINDLKNKDWDYRKVDTKRMTHGIHKYPARMVPQMTTELIELFSKKGDLILDPFSGSGTVITEALVLERKAIGNDLNPLARMISKVRTTPINRNRIDFLYRYIERDFSNYDNKKKINLDILIDEPNIKHWFKPSAIKKLAHIKNTINKKEINSKERDFLNICFSMCIRKSSNLRDKEYKTYRMSKEDVRKHNPKVFEIYKEIFKDFSDKLERLNSHIIENNIKSYVRILSEDSRRLSKIKNNSIDLIVTSPPYGDSRTTVAYGQFSRFPLMWMGLNRRDVLDVDEKLLGGKKVYREDVKINSKTFNKTIRDIADIDEKRAEDMRSFMVDLHLTLCEMQRVLKRNKYACLVVGNRCMRSVRVRMDKIIEEMCADNKFKHITTLYRDIPSKNNPTKSKFIIKGKEKWINTMSKESIIILRKG